MSIKELAEKFIKAEKDAFLKNDFTSLAELEDPNVVIHISPLGDFIGHEAQKKYILGATQAVSDLKVELKYLAGEGNFFLFSYKSSGKITGNTPGFPPAINKKLTNNFLFAVYVKKGKVAEIWANGSFNVSD
jgi:hypothetical protein